MILVLALPVVLTQFASTTDIVNSVSELEVIETDKPQAEVTLEEKVGQLFMIGHWSKTPTRETTTLIDIYNIGGVIIMDVTGDPRIIGSWSEEWQNVSYPTPLLVGIDQEGGLVSRIKDESYIQIGQPDITTTEQAYTVSSNRADALRALGINHNYSPVLDASVDSEAFMYDRVFREPRMIAGLGDAMVRGYQNNDVLAVPKHYPGHPDTSDDSHITLPILNLTPDEYVEHTEQFANLLRAGNTNLLMTAHVQVPSLDPDFPATVSRILIDDVRERVQYDGVIITDDLAMQAISDRWSYEESAVLALRAGVDMVMLAAEPEYASSTIEAVVQAVETGELSEDRIDEAYNRVQAVKENL